MEKYDKGYVVKFFFYACVIVICIFAVSFLFSKAMNNRDIESASGDDYDGVVYVIDAGHGGEDAGAIASDGTLEKDLNLQISKLIKVLCDLNGTRAVLTRDSDNLLYDYYNDLNDYTGHKKEYDLKNRVKIANEFENPIFISVHMNKFTQTKYSGTQIYYSKNNPSSQILARSIQNMTKTYIQPTNNRQVKQATSSIYVLNNAQFPAVLIECGFLSNEKELENLKTPSYQAKMSLVIFSSMIGAL